MRLPIVIMCALFSIVPISASYAHHGWSSYDATTPLTIEGSLATLRWANPHGAATVRHAGKNWDVVLAPITRMEARGLREEMLKPGKTITLVGYARNDGAAEMRIERIIVGEKTYELR